MEIYEERTRFCCQIYETVTDMAETIFDECGDPDGFCVQHCTWDCIIFGSYNRIKLTPKGWFLIEEACSAEFIAKFKEKYY